MDEIIYSTIYESSYEYMQHYSNVFYLNNKYNNIRIDLTVDKKEMYMLWGKVMNSYGVPIGGATVTLLKPFYIHGNVEYTYINTTKSDLMGLYHFRINGNEKSLKYRVIAVCK